MNSSEQLTTLPNATLFLRQLETLNVSKLPGFRKSHSVPTDSSLSSNRFVASLARPQIENELTEIHRLLRTHLGLKRKEIEVTLEENGSGFLETSLFNFELTIELDPANPSQVEIRRRLEPIVTPADLLDESLDQIFGDRFDSACLEFPFEIDVAEWIDAAEMLDIAEFRLDYNLAATECEVFLVDDPSWRLHLTSDAMILESIRPSSPKELIGRLHEVQVRLANAFRAVDLA